MKIQFEINKSVTPWECFIAGTDLSDFQDVTTVGCDWKKFYNPRTNELIDCFEVYKLALASQQST
jgi:hypothetical protein